MQTKLCTYLILSEVILKANSTRYELIIALQFKKRALSLFHNLQLEKLLTYRILLFDLKITFSKNLTVQQMFKYITHIDDELKLLSDDKRVARMYPKNHNTYLEMMNRFKIRVKSAKKEQGYRLFMEDVKKFFRHGAFGFLDFTACKFGFTRGEKVNLGIGCELVDMNLVNDESHITDHFKEKRDGFRNLQFVPHIEFLDLWVEHPFCERFMQECETKIDVLRIKSVVIDFLDFKSIKTHYKEPKTFPLLENAYLCNSLSTLIIDNDICISFLRDCVFNDLSSTKTNIEQIVLNKPSLHYSVKKSTLDFLFINLCEQGSSGISKVHPKLKKLSLNILEFEKDKLPTSELKVSEFSLLAIKRDATACLSYKITGCATISACCWRNKEAEIIGEFINTIDLNIDSSVKVEEIEQDEFMLPEKDFIKLAQRSDSLGLDSCLKKASYDIVVCISPSKVLKGNFLAKTPLALEDISIASKMITSKSPSSKLSINFQIGKKNGRSLTKPKCQDLFSTASPNLLFSKVKISFYNPKIRTCLTSLLTKPRLSKKLPNQPLKSLEITTPISKKDVIHIFKLKILKINLKAEYFEDLMEEINKETKWITLIAQRYADPKLGKRSLKKSPFKEYLLDIERWFENQLEFCNIECQVGKRQVEINCRGTCVVKL
ncbi:unnamed protein product [Moneuplotes crassus]|uniref:Uncharacterized protein n=1 Tax=Euplotes crassus TaxID=5936 RepID=A0AAD1Y1K4_EUPCR|nr:unnamed protein product [Moneuplotes crassus]